MFRDRTNLYISYRRTFPHQNALDHEAPLSRFDALREEEEGLIGAVGDDGMENAIQLQTLPPNFLELTQEIQDVLEFVGVKVEELNYAYKKNLLPGFTDTAIDMKKIDDLTFVITKNFQKSYNMIKKIDEFKYGQQGVLNRDELVMCENIKKKLALDTQTLSQRFRKLQNNYIKFLKDDEDYETNFMRQQAAGPGQRLSPGAVVDADELPDQDIESYSRQALAQSQQVLLQEEEQRHGDNQQLKQREEEISKIAMGVIEISTIFKELENMVIDQGTILDRIDYNLENVAVDLRQADREFVKSSQSQKQNQKCRLIFLLSLVVFALLLLVMLRPHHVVVDHHTTAPPAADSNSGNSSPANAGADTAGAGGANADDANAIEMIDDDSYS